MKHKFKKIVCLIFFVFSALRKNTLYNHDNATYCVQMGHIVYQITAKKVNGKYLYKNSLDSSIYSSAI